uniref:conjugal transfer nickase/helicase domain-containing protein n=1 Tax=Pseudomonas tolaasii TaxID=29442 RepID=UPI0018E1B70E
HLAEGAPLMLPLCRRLDELLTRASQGQPEPGTLGAAFAQVKHVAEQLITPGAAVDNEKTAHKALRTLQDQTRPLCIYWLKQKASDIRALRLARTLLWLPIDTLPEHNADKITALRGVPADKLAGFQERFAQRQYADLWLVSKTVSDKLRAHLLSQGISGIPERNTTLFNILQEHDLVLANPEGKAIWRATVYSDSGWTQTFTLLKLAPSLIWETEQRPSSFAGSVQVEPTAEPASAPEVSAEADKSPPPAPATPETSPGQQFLHWLREGLLQQRLALNDAKALLHTVDGTLFLVSPGIFRRYLQEHPEATCNAQHEGTSDWQWLQKQFERLDQHRKRPNDLNLWTCEVFGPRPGKRLHGYLLLQPQAVLPSVPFDNPYLRLMEGTH